MNSEGDPSIRAAVGNLVFSMVDDPANCELYAELLHEGELVDTENQMQAGAMEFTSDIVTSIHDHRNRTVIHDHSCPALPED